MANEENLNPLNQRTKSEQREITQKGGIASGKSRRRKKALRTALKEAMAMQLKELHPDMQAAIMKAAKLGDAELTVSDAVLGSIIRNACRGNSQMAKLLLDVLGETPDVRLKERELKMKEQALDSGQFDTTLNVTVKAKEVQGDEHSEGGQSSL
ncbi:hypothetical protein [uncultured Selenomonas sp.]|jgi:hypothetical protein|uniref:hypothetical protein n=1 Tax=uncultured Selenomonas sp. TaxID=159275 RepID=UPI0026021B0B|nr:hypothetical protein [uncultured Selenomonas sp.]